MNKQTININFKIRTLKSKFYNKMNNKIKIKK